jgi:putative membrane protein
MLNVAKAVLAAFWLLALVNLLVPFAGPYMTAIATLVLVIHGVEIAVLHTRLQRQARPAQARWQVLLFGVLHLRNLGA